MAFSFFIPNIRQVTPVKSKYYEELIERLKRTAAMYYPSNQSKLYSEAANAIEELTKERLRKYGKRLSNFRTNRKTKKH